MNKLQVKMITVDWMKVFLDISLCLNVLLIYLLLLLQVDLNGMRVAAHHSLLFSEMRLNRLLKTHLMSMPDVIANPPSEEECISMSEIEGVLNIKEWCTSLMQHEQLFTVANGLVCPSMYSLVFYIHNLITNFVFPCLHRLSSKLL